MASVAVAPAAGAMDPPRDLSHPGDEAEARYGRKLNRNPRVRNSCSVLFVIPVEVEDPADAASRFLYRPSLNSRKEPTRRFGEATRSAPTSRCRSSKPFSPVSDENPGCDWAKLIH